MRILVRLKSHVIGKKNLQLPFIVLCVCLGVNSPSD